jgi:fatty acid synthase subunit alpha, fungi type
MPEVHLSLNVRDTFTGPEIAIPAGNVEAFCAAAGNQQEKFKAARSEVVKAPMDFAIPTSRQAARYYKIST